MLTHEGVAHELTQAQYLALRRLQELGEQRMSDLATHLELTNSATTGLIERLDARGLVARRPDPEDGRGVRVAITGAGEAMVAQIRAALHAQLGGAFGELPAALRFAAVGGVLAVADAIEGLADAH